MMHSTRDLPIELASRPYVPVYVNDHGPYPFVLDTACRSASLANALVRRLSLPDDDGWVTVDSLAIGSSCWHGLGLGRGETGALAMRLSHRIDGFLGSRFFEQSGLVVTLDYRRGRLSLLCPEEADKPPAAVPICLANSYPLVPATFGDVGPVELLVDTGASACVVSPELAQRLGLELGGATAAHGAADSLAAHATVIPELTIGDVTVRHLDALVIDCSTASANAKRRVDGYLGHSLLSRFVVQIDYPGARLALS